MKIGKVCRKEYRCGEKMQMETGRAWKSVGTSEEKILRKNRIVVVLLPIFFDIKLF